MKQCCYIINQNWSLDIRMQRLHRLLIRPFLHHQTQFNFSKIIKMAPNKVQTQTEQYILKSIQSATQIFRKFSPLHSFPVEKTTPSQTCQRFIQCMSNLNVQKFQNRYFMRINSLQITEMVQKLKKDKILTNVIELLISQESFNKKQKKFLTNFLYCISVFIKKQIYSKKNSIYDLKFYQDFMIVFNQYFILLYIDRKLIINYLTLLKVLISTKTLDSNRSYFANQKLIIDYMIDHKATLFLAKKEFTLILSYISQAGVIANYPSKYFEFVDVLLSNLDNKWYLDQTFNQKKLVSQLVSLHYDCQKIIKGIIYLMNQQIKEQNFDTVCMALNSLLRIKAEVFDTKPVPKQYIEVLKRITAFIREKKRGKEKSNLQKSEKSLDDWQLQIYKELIPTLFRSSIWMEQIWFEFADWFDRGKNYNKIPVIIIYTIFDLLNIDKDIISQSIQDRLLKSKNLLLLNNNFRIQDVDLIKVYHHDFGNRMKNTYTSQQQIANCLRSVTKQTIKTQSLIRFFIVDILMNDKTIIQINNKLHYIQDEKKTKKVPNLKTAFRKRILNKLGYNFYEFEIQTIVQGTYEFLNTLEKQSKKQSN